ncbi:MAG: 3-isopropylmalate dehydratase [Fusobacteriaceae bacterium]|jgi:3-isopropylmalate/(R)-2-methylmalate dehydratase small subunit|nr:3-isopropylmalate dehydratase [Fusobacteriaceae bacterium]
MNNIIKGKVWKYGSNINTDIISPPAYMELSMKEAAKYAMSVIDPEFASQYKPGDIFVAEDNLGPGSSRETAPLTLKILGVKTIVAKSYARIFYRNCINLGILTLVCPETEKISKNDEIEINYSDGIIKNITHKEEYSCEKIPQHIMGLIDCDGLVGYLKTKIISGQK